MESLSTTTMHLVMRRLVKYAVRGRIPIEYWSHLYQKYGDSGIYEIKERFKSTAKVVTMMNQIQQYAEKRPFLLGGVQENDFATTIHEGNNNNTEPVMPLSQNSHQMENNAYNNNHMNNNFNNEDFDNINDFGDINEFGDFDDDANNNNNNNISDDRDIFNNNVNGIDNADVVNGTVEIDAEQLIFTELVNSIQSNLYSVINHVNANMFLKNEHSTSLLKNAVALLNSTINCIQGNTFHPELHASVVDVVTRYNEINK